LTKFLRLFAAAALVVAACGIGAQAQTPDATPATKEQAVAMVQNAVAFIKAQGPDKGYAAIDDKSGQFVRGDLYIAVVGLDGTLLAYGGDGQRVGENVMNLKDTDGKEVVKERVELAKQEPSFWQSYKFINPLTKKIEPKQMYCERLNETVVCGGVYQ
jgi:signal transduction histidine kinase